MASNLLAMASDLHLAVSVLKTISANICDCCSGNMAMIRHCLHEVVVDTAGFGSLSVKFMLSNRT